MKKIIKIGMALYGFTLLADTGYESTPYSFNAFVVYDYKNKTLSNSLPLSPDNLPQHFCIIVPDAHNPLFLKNKNKPTNFAGQDIKFALSDQQLMIPQSLYSDGMPPKPETATVLILDWLDTGITKDIESTTNPATSDIQNLMQKLPKANYTIIGIGRGGLVANNMIKDLPKEVVFITLGTPFAKDTSKHANLATVSTNVSHAYIFYSTIDYRPSSLLHPVSTNTPVSYPKNKTHLVRTIANNREQPVHNITFLKLQSVLDTCAKIRMQFVLHKDLSAAFSNMKPDTNGTVVILKPTESDDVFRIKVEKALSSKDAKKYKNEWGSNKALVKTDIAASARSQFKLSSTTTRSKKLSSKSA